VVIALGFVLFGSFVSQVYYVCQQHDRLHYKAQADQLYVLPPIEDFIGASSWRSNVEKTIPLPVGEFWKDPGHYLLAIASGVPLSLRIATLLMILSLLLAILLLPRLYLISKLCHSFDSLLIMSLAYIVSLFGYVFTWVDYNNLAAETNRLVRALPFDESDGIGLAENAVSRVSVGILITSFSVILVCRIMVDVMRVYQQWRELEEAGLLSVRPARRTGNLFRRAPVGQPVRYRRRSARRKDSYLM